MMSLVGSFKTEDFGNNWLQNAHEVIAPAPISWLPAAPFAYGAAMLLAVLIARCLYRRYRHWADNAYRREAIQQLQALQVAYHAGDKDCLRQLPLLLRRCALAAWPREQVAALQGEAWQEFLSVTAPFAADPYGDQPQNHQFNNEQLNELLQLAYMSPPQRQAISPVQANHYFLRCEQWLRGHQC